MEIDEKGKVVDYEIFESVIKSKKQMTYTNVNKILEENIIPEGYEEFVDKLKLMGDCAKRLRKAKIKNGKLITSKNGHSRQRIKKSDISLSELLEISK